MTNKEAINELAEMGNVLQIIPNTRKGQALKMAIKALNAEPIRPKGEWIVDESGNTICPFCKKLRRDSRIDHISFCNSCGADMRGE